MFEESICREIERLLSFENRTKNRMYLKVDLVISPKGRARGHQHSDCCRPNSPCEPSFIQLVLALRLHLIILAVFGPAAISSLCLSANSAYLAGFRSLSSGIVVTKLNSMLAGFRFLRASLFIL